MPASRVPAKVVMVTAATVLMLGLSWSAGLAAAQAGDGDHLTTPTLLEQDGNGGGAKVKEEEAVEENLSFTHAFLASFSMMIVSEIGDKTFFIAAIMAMQHPRAVIFVGAIGALAIMTVMSAYFGRLASYLPRFYTHVASVILFVVFGFKMLYEGYYMAPDEGMDELEEVQTELKAKEEEREAAAGIAAKPSVWPILSQAFIMTFLAEWGDRSQIATIILGARESPIGVSVGAILGHSVCTCMAVVGGRMLATQISVRSVTLVGGAVFLLFAISAVIVEDIMTNNTSEATTMAAGTV